MRTLTCVHSHIYFASIDDPHPTYLDRGSGITYAPAGCGVDRPEGSDTRTAGRLQQLRANSLVQNAAQRSTTDAYHNHEVYTGSMRVNTGASSYRRAIYLCSVLSLRWPSILLLQACTSCLLNP